MQDEENLQLQGD